VINELLDRIEAAEKEAAYIKEEMQVPVQKRVERDALRVEVERLTECLHRANSQAEHFEREWYLRGDEVDALRAKIAEMEKQKPVAWTTKLALIYGASRWGFQASGVNMWGEKGVPLYTLPGAKGE